MNRFGIPAESPKPSLRPEYRNPELTVPEPSLISEWNSKLIISDESDEDEGKTNGRASSTQVAEKSVKFCDTQEFTNIQSSSEKNRKTRRSEPILNYSSPQPRNAYFQSVENLPNSGSAAPAVMMNHTYAHPGFYQSGTIELIEVIRKQEIEIHKHKTLCNKQQKQLKLQAKTIQTLKDKITKFESIEFACRSTQTFPLATEEVMIQTEPIPTKRTKDIQQQTSFIEDVIPDSKSEIQMAATTAPFHYSTSGTSSPSHSNPSDNEQRSENSRVKPNANLSASSTDDSDDSDQELSPEDLRKLMDEINQSTRKKTPQKALPEVDCHLSSPPRRELNTPKRSENTIFLQNLAPSYGLQASKRYESNTADESICGQIAKKYGLSSPEAIPVRRSVSDDSHIMSGDMSIATANYLDRHIYAKGDNKIPHRTHQYQNNRIGILESPLLSRKKSSSPDEIINFDELQKIEKYK